MTKLEKLKLLSDLLKEFELPISPILEFTINDKIEEAAREEGASAPIVVTQNEPEYEDAKTSEKRTAQKNTNASVEFKYYILTDKTSKPSLYHTIKMRAIPGVISEKLFRQYLIEKKKPIEYADILKSDVENLVNMHIQPVSDIFVHTSAKGVEAWAESLQYVTEYASLSIARKLTIQAALKTYGRCLVDSNQRELRAKVRNGEKIDL